MKTKSSPSFDCDCTFPVNRRTFLKTTVGGVAAVATGCVSSRPEREVSAAGAVAQAKSETLVTSLYKTLTEEQRKEIAFPFDHPLRSKVDNNWHITKKKVSEFSKDQQEMVRQIFLGLHSPEYAEKVMQQVIHDSGKEGFESSSVALFGEPDTGKFEFVLTGRH